MMYTPEFIANYIQSNWAEFEECMLGTCDEEKQGGSAKENRRAMDHTSSSVVGKSDLSKTFKKNPHSICTDFIIEEVRGGDYHKVKRISDKDNQNSVILKMLPSHLDDIQPDHLYSVTSASRTTLEYEALVKLHSLLGSFVPCPYVFDDSKSWVMMEDLHPHMNLKDKILNGAYVELFGSMGSLGKSLYELHRKTGLGNMAFEEKYDLLRMFGSERCVNHLANNLCARPLSKESSTILNKRSSVNLTVKQAIENIRGDEAILEEVRALKKILQEQKEVLCHGDLHVNSVMVLENSAKMLDWELALVGPKSLDMGILFGSLLTMYFMQPNETKNRDGVLETMQALWEAYMNAREEDMTEASLKGAAPKIEDVVGFAALQMLRNIVFDKEFYALVADIPDSTQKEQFEIDCLEMAKILLKNHNCISTFQSLRDTVTKKCLWLF
eukprot:Nk52_evm94s164 gene=Nk52_evmTU94s164